MLIGMAGCNLQQEKPTIAAKDTSYRALGNYCLDEVARLRAQNVQVTKIVRLNGVMDSVETKDSAALETLFRPLMDADVSKPSLSDAYSRDTIANLFQPDTTFIFRSKGKQTHPYQLILDVDPQGNIKTAHATAHSSNLVYEYRQEVFYERNKQLRVVTYQKIVFMKPENMEVLALFHPSTKKI
jgi:hypothetical protein